MIGSLEASASEYPKFSIISTIEPVMPNVTPRKSVGRIMALNFGEQNISSSCLPVMEFFRMMADEPSMGFIPRQLVLEIRSNPEAKTIHHRYGSPPSFTAMIWEKQKLKPIPTIPLIAEFKKIIFDA